jgi:hypothetical protein
LKFKIRRLRSFLEKSILPLTALFFVFSTVVGAIRNYSPVPFWDMWDGYIGFYEQLSKGHMEMWWAPHNEHRILFSRLFFWLDIKFLHGLSLLLIPLNLLLMVLLWLVLSWGTIRLFGANSKRGFVIVVASWLAVICFSWMQKENIAGAFQNGFFAAFLFPMLAFQSTALSTSSSQSRFWFGMSLLFGVISVATLANGFLTWPLLALMTILLGQSKIRIAMVLLTTLLLSFVSIGAAGATSPVTDSLRLHFAEFLPFLLVYLGGPFRVISNDLVVAEIAGAFFIAGAVTCLWIGLKTKESNAMFLAFVMFILYVGTTALVTTSGRVIFGVGGATAGRYLTPMLLGWAVLSILFSYHYREHANYPGATWAISIFFPLFLLPSQFDALRGNPQLINHRHMIAGLALDLGINDPEIIQTIYPDDRIYATSKEAVRSHLSIFGLSTFRNARRYLEQDAATLPFLHECQGYIDAISSVKGVNGVSRVSGWAYDRSAAQVPEEVFMVDVQNKIVGVALTGTSRMDVESPVNRKASLSGFDGYVFGDAKNVRLNCASPQK